MLDILVFIRNVILVVIMAILGIQAGGSDDANETVETAQKSAISAIF